MKSAKATSAGRLSAVGLMATISADAQSTIERMPTPEIGLFEAPIKPAMNPQIAAIRNPPSSTNGIAINVSVIALGASTVDFAKVYASQPATARQPAVSA